MTIGQVLRKKSHILVAFVIGLTAVSCGEEKQVCAPQVPSDTFRQWNDSLVESLNWPSDIQVNGFSRADITPSPACLAVAPNGDVFVGVDMIGSLGKDPYKGSIVKLVDCDNDGFIDSHSIYASVDNPRGILPIGNKLYVLHTQFSEETGKATGMDLVVFEDENQDGKADGPSKPILEHISSPKFLQSRGTDHATNGIQMGIDGWIYIAVGDFGFHGAIDREGTELTMLGGGVLRVRPDGTEMEVYTHGLRNIYDVAIDPYMNIFTRGNTNDGGGWNIRFIHQIQSGEYGYPVLFKNFTDEILPALVDVGGGSGAGSLFMNDPNWPDKYNNVPMMADWGRSHLYIHRVREDGPSFMQKEEEFLGLSQITDLDIDASGRIYMSAWDGAGYSGSPDKGFVVRAVPQGWQYKPFADLEELSENELATLLTSESAKIRLHVQQELLTRNKKNASEAVWKIASDISLRLEAQVAGIFTYAQIAGIEGIEDLVSLTKDSSTREFALRALADRKSNISDVPLEPFLKALKDSSERVKAVAIVGLGRLGNKAAIRELLKVPVPTALNAPEKGVEGPHATPNANVILPHLAVRTLLKLDGVEESVEALGTRQSKLALWTLRHMHNTTAVNGLIKTYKKTDDDDLKKEILTTISRLYKKEAPYDGSWWWSTRPDTHGPYYKGITWEGSGIIKEFLVDVWENTNTNGKDFFSDLNARHRMGIIQFGGDEPGVEVADSEAQVDLEKIKNKKGQIGKSSIEDIMLAMAKIKGDAELGEKLFTQQGCVACHSIKKEELMKGPFMGQIGSIMNREQIAESILKPNASISQGFASVLIGTKDGKSYSGFVSEESAEKLIIRNIVGQVSTLKIEDIEKREELENSMMPAGLANSLSFEEFASLITFLHQQK
ncbi:MAG: c-type cytochrome [Maribacter sp.]|nr:c-type cytochrome [Maribacter sp.]